MVIDHSRPLKDFVMGRFTRQRNFCDLCPSQASMKAMGIFVVRNMDLALEMRAVGTWNGETMSN